LGQLQLLSGRKTGDCAGPEFSFSIDLTHLRQREWHFAQISLSLREGGGFNWIDLN